MAIPSMSDMALKGQRVLVRQDLNVPVKDGKVTSDARIKASIPTIKAALDAGAAVMVMSHLGRPTEGEPADEFSLQPVVDYLNDALDVPVKLVKDYLYHMLANPDTLICRLFGLYTIRFAKQDLRCKAIHLYSIVVEQHCEVRHEKSIWIQQTDPSTQK